MRWRVDEPCAHVGFEEISPDILRCPSVIERCVLRGHSDLNHQVFGVRTWTYWSWNSGGRRSPSAPARCLHCQSHLRWQSWGPLEEKEESHWSTAFFDKSKTNPVCLIHPPLSVGRSSVRTELAGGGAWGSVDRSWSSSRLDAAEDGLAAVSAVGSTTGCLWGLFPIVVEGD